MKMKNKLSLRKRFMAAMLAMILCMATSLSAFAGTGGTFGDEQKAIFTKTLQYADGLGLTTPTADFTFTFKAVSKDGAASAAVNMPVPADVTLNFSSGDSGSSIGGGMYAVSKTSNDVLSSLDWTILGAGRYEYEVKEIATVTSPSPLGTGETINSSEAVYTLYVVVVWDSTSNAYVVEQTFSDQTTSDTGGPGGGKGGANTTDGDYNFEFTNTYTKQGGSTPGTDSLTITKAVSGTGSDPNKQFTYTITANDSVTGIAAKTYTGTYTRMSGSSGTTTPITLTADGSSQTFTLAAGEKIVFDNLPVGTTFTVVESGEAGYIPSYSGTTGASVPISGVGTSGNDLSTGIQIIGSINNVVNYTNVYDSSLIPTGVLSNIAPFAVLIAVAILAFVAFAAMNRRKASR